MKKWLRSYFAAINQREIKTVGNYLWHVRPSRWWPKSIFHQEDKIVAGCSVRFTWFFDGEHRRKTKADRLTANVCRARFPEPSGVERRLGMFLLFFSFFPAFLVCVRHPRQDYLILALIAERTKREWPYPATIAIVVHDLRAAASYLVPIEDTYLLLVPRKRKKERERKEEPHPSGPRLPSCREIVPRTSCHVQVAT